MIPSDEIWIKVGGDKGGGTFKMSFQIANIPSPNSTQNTVVFNLFQAPDSYSNIKLALQRYVPHVNQLQHLLWKYVLISCL